MLSSAEEDALLIDALFRGAAPGPQKPAAAAAAAPASSRPALHVKPETGAGPCMQPRAGHAWHAWHASTLPSACAPRCPPGAAGPAANGRAASPGSSQSDDDLYQQVRGAPRAQHRSCRSPATRPPTQTPHKPPCPSPHPPCGRSSSACLRPSSPSRSPPRRRRSPLLQAPPRRRLRAAGQPRSAQRAPRHRHPPPPQAAPPRRSPRPRSLRGCVLAAPHDASACQHARAPRAHTHARTQHAPTGCCRC